MGFLTDSHEAGMRTMIGRRFDWGGRLPKSNGGARRSPGAGAGPKGLAVRQLKRYVSWVQNVARQFGPYLLRAQEQ